VSEPSLVRKVERVARALTEAGIPHAFGGAMALAYYAVPRVTLDIDLNVFVAPTKHEATFGVLGVLGVQAPGDTSRLEADGQIRLRWGRTPIDLFFAFHPIHDAMRRDTRSVTFGADRIAVVSPEHLLVCKVVFDRTKDWMDIEQMLAATPVDLEEVHRWLREILDGSDERRMRFERLTGGVIG
jgi:hypothetical protein